MMAAQPFINQRIERNLSTNALNGIGKQSGLRRADSLMSIALKR
jgi:hypothetical protein